jgi:hypothetical protein
VDESRHLSGINGTINHCDTYACLRTVLATGLRQWAVSSLPLQGDSEGSTYIKPPSAFVTHGSEIPAKADLGSGSGI